MGLLMTRPLLPLAIASVALAAAHSAFAADLSVKAPAFEAPVPISPWEGYYIGANVGYSRAKDDLAVPGFTVNGVLVPGAAFAELEPSGAFGGVQAGVNWQSSYWAYGLEADFQGSDQRDSITSATAVSFTGSTRRLVSVTSPSVPPRPVS